MARNQIKHVIDCGFSELRVDRQRMEQILSKAKGGEQVKRKLPLMLVAALVALSIALTAAAATLLWEHYVLEIKQKEKNQGHYVNWPVSDKVALVKNLSEMDYIEGSEQVKTLLAEATPEEEKGALADALMLELTGQKDVREIHSNLITYALLGPEDFWTSAQRVWWTQAINSVRDTSHDPDELVLPLGHEVPEAEAIAIARAAIIQAFGMAPDALDQAQPVADLYITKARPDYRRWMVQFKFYKEGTSDWTERVLFTVVDEKGEVIADPDVGTPSLEEMAASHQALEEQKKASKPPIIQAYINYVTQENYALFWDWPLEAKAAFSKEIRPMMAEAEQKGELIQYFTEEGRVIAGADLRLYTAFAYGLPGPEDIPQEAAIEKAKQALMDESGASRQSLEGAGNVLVYFDVSDPEKPLWKFFFGPNWEEDTQPRKAYRAQIDARNGEVVLSEAINWKDMKGDDLRRF